MGLTAVSVASAEDAQRWTHSTQAFSLDPASNGLADVSSGAITVFERHGDAAGDGCTLVARTMPTTRSQEQINATTQSYRLNEPGIRDFESTEVDGVSIVSFTRVRPGEPRTRRVRLFAVAAGSTAVFGELACEGAAPLPADLDTVFAGFLSSLRFARGAP